MDLWELAFDLEESNPYQIPMKSLLGGTGLALFVLCGFAFAGEFRIATYNLGNYLDYPAESRPAKSAEAKARIRASIRAINPDVLALQEIGGLGALLSLRESLKAEGMDFPYWEHIAGHETNVQVAVLSRFPLTARRAHTNDQFLLGGRRHWVSRGFSELDIEVNRGYSFTLIAAHLKSRRPVPMADEAELRFEEARILRQKIDARLEVNPEANLVVLGDLNDSKDSSTLKTIIGRGKRKLVDTRPAERNGEAPGADGIREAGNVTWTHHYATADTYSRIDYVLLSPGMAREWSPQATYVLSTKDWDLASDHRPLVAGFEAQDK
jgi:endonuclease/exonuclease/phosphatase family metal-dependent hydrolase